MNSYDIKSKVENDPDFIALRRFDYSLAKLLERYPDGCPDRIIASALGLTEEQVVELYETAVARLRLIVGVTE